MSSAQAPAQPATPLLLLRSLLFSLGMLLSTGIVSSLVVCVFFLPFQQRYRVSRLWSRFNLWWLRVTCNIDYQIQGIEHIPSATQPVVVIAKHQSTWETIFLHAYLPPIAWVVKRELLWLPFFGWALWLLRPIAINRQAGASSVKHIIRQGKQYLGQGQWVLIFPEGTRVAPGVHQRYGSGGAVLAAQSGCPILPVALNAGEFWPRRGFIKRPGTIHVVFGALLHSDRNMSAHALNREVEDWIEGCMTEISAMRP